MCRKIHILPAVAFAVLMISAGASAQVSVLATGSAAKTSGNIFTSAELGGFSPPPTTDKLVVIISDEGGVPSSVTYNGQAMSKALEYGSGQYVGIYYIDYTSAPASGDLVVNGSSGSGVSVFALQGTGDDFGASATSSSSSISLDALFDGSVVIAGLVANQNSGTYTGTADAPLTPLLTDANVGSSLGVSGYAANVTAGTNTYTFSNLSAGAPKVVAMAFPAAGADDIPPAIATTVAFDHIGNPTNSLLTDPAITFNFDEAIVAGSGSILLKEDGGTTVQTYDVTNAYQLTFGIDSLTITPDVLDPETSYYVQIPGGAIEDASGNSTNYPDDSVTFATGPWLTASFRLSTGGTKSTTTLREFDPSGYDKLIVIVMGEGDGPTDITWGGSSTMTPTVSNWNGIERVFMWHLDGPFSGPDTISLSGALDAYGLSLLALKGTDPGVAAFTNASSSSVNLATTSDESFVVAGYAVNGGGTPAFGAAPLTTYFSRETGSADGACGVAANSTIGSQTFSFTGNVSTPSIVVAEFIITPPPAGTVLVIR